LNENQIALLVVFGQQLSFIKNIFIYQLIVPERFVRHFRFPM